MDHFIYCADVYCPSCTRKILIEQKGATDILSYTTAELLRDTLLRAGKNPDNEHTWDSDDFPKGPFDDQESDSPQHCGDCNVFLAQPLTKDGMEYLIEQTRACSGDSAVLREWYEFYGEDCAHEDGRDLRRCMRDEGIPIPSVRVAHWTDQFVGKMSGDHLTDAAVASKVRMMERHDIDHEAVCVLARDRIAMLAREECKLAAAVLSIGYHAMGRKTPGMFATDSRCELAREVLRRNGYDPAKLGVDVE